MMPEAIEDIKDERVALYTEYKEPQLLHYNEPGRGVFIAETPMVIERAMQSGAKPLSFFAESGAVENEEVKCLLDRAPTVPVYAAPLNVINTITGFNLTRGMLAAFERPHLPETRDILQTSEKVAVLEDVVNPTNVGAIFRSAAALGADAVLLTSACADPFYRRAARVAMGTVFMIPWTYIPKEAGVTELLHEHSFSVISMALSQGALSLSDPSLKYGKRKAVIFGSEGDGISDATLSGSDFVAKIPMHQNVDSLNVAAASAVAFCELFKDA